MMSEWSISECLQILKLQKTFKSATLKTKFDYKLLLSSSLPVESNCTYHSKINYFLRKITFKPTSKLLKSNSGMQHQTPILQFCIGFSLKYFGWVLLLHDVVLDKNPIFWKIMLKSLFVLLKSNSVVQYHQTAILKFSNEEELAFTTPCLANEFWRGGAVENQ